MNKLFCFFLIVVTLEGCSDRVRTEKASFVEGRNIVADSGMVVSAHPQASEIGVSILQKGGNAIDAAIATEFALAVCFPEAGNIGGGGFMLIRTSNGNTDVIDYREKAPSKASRDMYLDITGKVTEGSSTDTQLSAGVPGTVDGLICAHLKYGKLPFKFLIQPAIDMAEKGFRLTSGQANELNNNRQVFINRNSSKTAFVKYNTVQPAFV